jgi:hypothetical protein
LGLYSISIFMPTFNKLIATTWTIFVLDILISVYFIQRWMIR